MCGRSHPVPPGISGEQCGLRGVGIFASRSQCFVNALHGDGRLVGFVSVTVGSTWSGSTDSGEASHTQIVALSPFFEVLYVLLEITELQSMCVNFVVNPPDHGILLCSSTFHRMYSAPVCLNFMAEISNGRK